MQLTVSSVEEAIIKLLDEEKHLALLFDGWSEPTLLLPKENHFCSHSLPSLTAAEHIYFVLDLYRIEIRKVSCLFGGNCSTNKA
jgi:hypothetical protein